MLVGVECSADSEACDAMMTNSSLRASSAIRSSFRPKSIHDQASMDSVPSAGKPRDLHSALSCATFIEV